MDTILNTQNNPDKALKGMPVKTIMVINVKISEGNVNYIHWNNTTVIYLSEMHQGNSKRNLARLGSVERTEKGGT